MNEKILAFLKNQTAASICCINENREPYCFSCFFAFDAKDHLLYFKSNRTTLHSQNLLNNPVVSGTIMPDKLNKLAIKGIQFTGITLDEKDPLATNASKVYHAKFPLAKVISGTVWTIQLNQIKMTDHIAGIFKKHNWQREAKQIRNLFVDAITN